MTAARPDALVVCDRAERSEDGLDRLVGLYASHAFAMALIAI